MKITTIAALLLAVLSNASHARELSVAEWQTDLDYLVERITTVHPNPYRRITREAFERNVAELRADLPGLESRGVVVRLMQLTASIQDGHTNLEPSDPNGFNQWFPVRFYRFSDGLYLTAVPKDRAALAGARVTRIGRLPAEEAHELAAGLKGADNAMGRLNATFYLSNATAMHTLGVIDDPAELPLELILRSGERRSVTLDAIESEFDLDWQFYGEHFGPPGTDLVTAWGHDGMALLNATENDSLPLHVRARRAWWWTPVPQHDAVYMQVGAVARTSSWSKDDFETLYGKMFDYVDAHDVGTFILDIRYNSGGNGRLVTEFVHEFIKREDTINRPGRLFTILGRKTFSAAVMLQAAMREHTNTLFVGEPSAAALNSYGDAGSFELPNSGMRLHLSTLYWQYSEWSDQRSIVPIEVPAVFSGNAYFSGTDPALEAIFAAPVYRTVPAVLQAEGAAAARTLFQVRERRYGHIDWWQPWDERELNTISYRLLRSGRKDDAIEGFRMNTERYPDAWNTWDSLGDAYLQADRKAEALSSYSRALEVDPDNSNSGHQRSVVQELSQPAEEASSSGN